MQDWWWFPYVIWRQAMGQAYTGVAAPDASTTACCVYTQADISHAVERYGIPEDAVVAVGNPDLVRFRVSKEDLGVCLSSNWARSKEVMYIDTALIEAGAVFDSAYDFSRHLLNTKEVLARQGLELVVKLHPAHFRTGVPELLKQANVELCASEDFLARLKKCCACIVEPSSLALIPALLGMPLFLAQYGKLKEQRYGEVLTSYPNAKFLADLHVISNLLAAVEGLENIEDATRWIHLNAGPVPAEEMPDRVSEVMAALISGHRLTAI
jgi:hypothetical protein